VVGGAVIGVVGVLADWGVEGMLAPPADHFPFIRESHFLVAGVMLIRARENFCEMLRSRLCGADLMMGEAAEVVEVS